MITPHNLIKLSRPILDNKAFFKLGLNSVHNKNALSKELIEDLHFCINQINMDN